MSSLHRRGTYDWFVDTASKTAADLVLGVAAVALAVGAILLTDSVALRALFGLPLLVFLPGYGLVLVAFPRREGEPPGGLADDAPMGDAGETIAGDAGDEHRQSASSRPTIGLFERIALSFGLSLSLVPMALLVVEAAALRITAGAVAGSVGLLAVGLLGVGHLRRRRVPAQDRFRPTFARLLSGVTGFDGDGESDLDAAITAVLAAGMIVAMTGLAYGLVAPGGTDSYTEAYLLGANESGELVESDYPRTLTRGETAAVHVAVENNEGAQTAYTVVAELHRVDASDGETTITEREALGRMQLTVDDQSTATREFEVTPTLTGEDLRLTYYLYHGDAPEEPTAETAAEYLYLWVSVDEPTTDAEQANEPT